jgi:hypothetical protein
MTNDNNIKAILKQAVPYAAKGVATSSDVVKALIEASIKAEYNKFNIRKEIAGVASETVNKFIDLLDAIEKNQSEKIELILNNDSLTFAEKKELIKLSEEINLLKAQKRKETMTNVMKLGAFVVTMVTCNSLGTTAINQGCLTARTQIRANSYSLSALVKAIKH